MRRFPYLLISLMFAVGCASEQVPAANDTTIHEDECPGAGIAGCKGDYRVVCERGDGVNVWVTAGQCEFGCKNGECVRGNSCTDECPDDMVTGCTASGKLKVCLMGDGCLDWKTVAECSRGCVDGRCVEDCVPDCDGRECGDNGCGGSCGGCPDGESCVDGLCGCVPTCRDRECGDNGCGGSCGGCGNNGRCRDGQCQACVPDCDGRECGDNGCDGTCGSCGNDGDCINGRCEGCTPDCTNRECGSNGCDGSCGSCADGASCTNGKCHVCIADCDGKNCGSNGCGGSCGSCAGGKTCDNNGVCQSGAGAGTVTGSLWYDTRYPVVDGSQITLSGKSTSSAYGVLATVTDSTGKKLGAARTNQNGEFAITLSRALSGGEIVAFSTAWAPEVTAPALMAVMKPGRAGEPDMFTALPWTWKADVPLDGEVGKLTITEAQGSGALFLYMYNVSAYEDVLSGLLGGDSSKITSLAILWLPGQGWSCGACYVSDYSQRLTGGPTLSQSIFVGGEAGGSSAWGWPVILHEFGHYVAGNYSRDDSPGGEHSLGVPVAPPFAWSEGWASFYGASTMSRWEGKAHSIYWDIQGGDSFWIDFDSASTAYEGVPVAPDANAGITQELDEMWVSVMLWHLWNGLEVPESAEQKDGVALGTTTVFNAIRSSRFMSGDRGYRGADFVDFVDAVGCNDSSIKADVAASVKDYLGFPYVVANATCK